MTVSGELRGTNRYVAWGVARRGRLFLLGSGCASPQPKTTSKKHVTHARQSRRDTSIPPVPKMEGQETGRY